ncbi:hypothetical protein EPO15_13885 [bacterium]|nr:MAG: hypothetical protein EPO15_13885 [bacterium]
METATAPRECPTDRLTSLVGVPVVGEHSVRHLQCAVAVLAGEAGLSEETLSRLQADCARLAAELLVRAPEGSLVMLRIVRPGGGIGLEVTADYGPTEHEPLGGRLGASAWESAV